jgi:hypothetical protein
MILDLAKIYAVKTLFIVAPVTGVTELSLVNIVLAMTVDTSPVFLVVLLQGFGVTGMAMKVGVSMPELERCFVMIEIPYQPGIGVMA